MFSIDNVFFSSSLSASIWGFETTACYSKPAFISPTPLLRDPRSVIGRIQPQFVDKHFGFALCVGPGSASSSIEVSRHQINDLSAIQARAMALAQQQQRGGGGGSEPQYDDEDDGFRGSNRGERNSGTISRRGGGGGSNRQQVVHPVKAAAYGRGVPNEAEEPRTYKAVKAKPPKPPAIPKIEWHPVHPIPGSKEANALKFQDATFKYNRGGILSMSSDVMGDHTQAAMKEQASRVTMPGQGKGAAESNGKRGIEIKRLRGKRKLGSTRSVHHLY